jgi:hypothetical protein
LGLLIVSFAYILKTILRFCFIQTTDHSTSANGDALMRFRLYVHHHLRLVWHAISSVDTRSFFLLKTITKESTYFTGKREGMQMK